MTIQYINNCIICDKEFEGTTKKLFCSKRCYQSNQILKHKKQIKRSIKKYLSRFKKVNFFDFFDLFLLFIYNFFLIFCGLMAIVVLAIAIAIAINI